MKIYFSIYTVAKLDDVLKVLDHKIPLAYTCNERKGFEETLSANVKRFEVNLNMDYV